MKIKESFKQAILDYLEMETKIIEICTISNNKGRNKTELTRIAFNALSAILASGYDLNFCENLSIADKVVIEKHALLKGE